MGATTIIITKIHLRRADASTVNKYCWFASLVNKFPFLCLDPLKSSSDTKHTADQVMSGYRVPGCDRQISSPLFGLARRC